MTWAMYDALVEACDARRRRSTTVRVFVLRAAGDAFAAGTDIRQFTDVRLRRRRHRLRAAARRRHRSARARAGADDRAGPRRRRRRRLRHRARLRPARVHAGSAVRRADRAHARQLPLGRQLRPARRPRSGRRAPRICSSPAGCSTPAEARVARPGDAHRGTGATSTTAVRDLAQTIAANAPLTIRATKEIGPPRSPSAAVSPPARPTTSIAACYASAGLPRRRRGVPREAPSPVHADADANRNPACRPGQLMNLAVSCRSALAVVVSCVSRLNVGVLVHRARLDRRRLHRRDAGQHGDGRISQPALPHADRRHAALRAGAVQRHARAADAPRGPARAAATAARSRSCSFVLGAGAVLDRPRQHRHGGAARAAGDGDGVAHRDPAVPDGDHGRQRRELPAACPRSRPPASSSTA